MGRQEKIEPQAFGIDETGRGPVHGPMVFGIAWCPMSFLHAGVMERIGIRDSKELTASERENVLKKIDSIPEIQYEVFVVSPQQISWQMLKSTKVNLNQISYNAIQNLIQTVLHRGVNLTHGFFDMIGSEAKFRTFLHAEFGKRFSSVIKPGADRDFPLVGAASIAAKIRRDHLVAQFVRTQPINPGPGTPSNPLTKRWLLEMRDDVFGYPTDIRFSWKTVERVIDHPIRVSWAGLHTQGDRREVAAPPLCPIAELELTHISML
eukprot:gnl/Chilomastix_cuspidata/6061.p1 GENE.gnl/Chilomastix_cuspidata/6061~~gnl/Chilomastix_cuspidata/6061.p1  ORF type:complete len:264 (+),score=21.58 gnl/Chilomastix_cuspidata/6061:128-919(+)